MVTEHLFVETIEELTDSVLEFNSEPKAWRKLLGPVPKYFVHVKNGQTHSFGLSKFCALKGLTVEEYLESYRYKTDGGTTQKHIAWLTGQNWIPRKKINKAARKAFDQWVSSFFPNYDLDKASFISLTKRGTLKKPKEKFVTPADLHNMLELQKQIGWVGEEIALRFEAQRLMKQGIKKPYPHIEHVSKKNAAAGYDIKSTTKAESRYIEVKSSLNERKEFFITENEVKKLEGFGHEAFLYLVHISDLTKREGRVIEELDDPIKKLRLVPIAYKAEIKEEK